MGLYILHIHYLMKPLVRCYNCLFNWYQLWELLYCEWVFVKYNSESVCTRTVFCLARLPAGFICFGWRSGTPLTGGGGGRGAGGGGSGSDGQLGQVGGVLGVLQDQGGQQGQRELTQLVPVVELQGGLRRDLDTAGEERRLRVSGLSVTLRHHLQT